MFVSALWSFFLRGSNFIDLVHSGVCTLNGMALGGCLLELPCESRWCPAAKKKFLPLFLSKMLASGGEVEKYLGGGWFPDIQKKVRKNFSRHKPIKLRVKKFLRTNSSYNIHETLIFWPISVKFRSINSIQFPLEALEATFKITLHSII